MEGRVRSYRVTDLGLTWGAHGKENGISLHKEFKNLIENCEIFKLFATNYEQL